ncbi:MAG: NUDIX hydrolase [Desulfobacteraceae bacterium]
MSRREYPPRPVPAVAGVIFEKDSVLLARRAAEPALGEWSLPGGVVELGETLFQALERELFEEAGVKIQVGGLVHVAERIVRDCDGRIRFHYVIADYWGNIASGRPTAGSDVKDVCLVPLERIASLPLAPEVKSVIVKAAGLRAQSCA